jgi:hypothetical protein
MPLTKLQFKPGIDREASSYSNEGGWRECDKVRFRFGFAEKIGGWTKYNSTAFVGTARDLHAWVALDGSRYLGLATHLKYYIVEGGSLFDITPIRATQAGGSSAVVFAATNGSTTVTVTDAGHAAGTGDFVVFSGVQADGLGSGGNVTKAILERTEGFQITRLSSSTYSIEVPTAADGSTDDENGGADVQAQYQVSVGLDTQVGGTGWSAGFWSGTTETAKETTINEGGTFSNSDTTLTVTSSNPTHQIAANDFILIDSEILKVTNVSTNDLTVTRAQKGTSATTHANGAKVILIAGNASTDSDYVGWGQAAALTTEATLRTWSHDNFGEDLLINIRDGGIYYWDRSDGLGTRATLLSAEGGATATPTIAKQIMVSNQGHVIAFGCDTEANPGTQDPLIIRTSSNTSVAASLTKWQVEDTETAQELRLASGSAIVAAIKTRTLILVITDNSAYAMTYQGGTSPYSLQTLSEGISITSPKAAVAVGEFVFWMGRDSFYMFDGNVRQMPCTLHDYVFTSFNDEQNEKIAAGHNSSFGEVWWFYPSENSSTIDRYVVYNYQQQVWYNGSMVRTAWEDRGVHRNPIAAGTDGYLYYHEDGFDDGSTSPSSAITASIESSQIDMGDGEQFTLVRRLIPDITFRNSEAITPSADFTVKVRDFPGANYSESVSGTTERSATTPVEQFTNQTHLRLRGRSFALKVESTGAGVGWRLGSPRIDIRPDGRR